MTLSEFIAKWDIRFADNDLFLVDEADLREFKDDLAQLIGAGSLSGRSLNELGLPMAVTSGGWYLVTGNNSPAIWEARRDFTASAYPIAGANWRLVVRFGSDVTVASITDASTAGRSLLLAADAPAQLGLLDKLTIEAGKYGAHPAFTRAYTEQGLLVYLLQKAFQQSPAPAVQQPAAPTDGQVDDKGDTFSFKPTAAYPSFAQYQVSGLPLTTGAEWLNGANSYVQNGRIYIRVVGAVDAGGLAVYVGASGAIPAGRVLTNDKPFTANNVAPAVPGALAVVFTVGNINLSPGDTLTFSAKASGGTAPYAHSVQALNPDSGVVTVLGTANTPNFIGTWPQVPAGVYLVTDAVTDAAGTALVSETRRVVVAAPGSGSGTLLPATTTRLGGIKVGARLSIDDEGNLSVDNLLESSNRWKAPNYFEMGIQLYNGAGFDEYGQLKTGQIIVGDNFSWRSNVQKMASAALIGWSPDDYVGQANGPDVGLARASAGVLEVNNGTKGSPATISVLDVLVSSVQNAALNTFSKLAAIVALYRGNNNTTSGSGLAVGGAFNTSTGENTLVGSSTAVTNTSAYVAAFGLVGGTISDLQPGVATSRLHLKNFATNTFATIQLGAAGNLIAPNFPSFYLSRFRQEYATGIAYDKGDIFTKDGGIYSATTSATATTNSTFRPENFTKWAITTGGSAPASTYYTTTYTVQAAGVQTLTAAQVPGLANATAVMQVGLVAADGTLDPELAEGPGFTYDATTHTLRLLAGSQAQGDYFQIGAQVRIKYLTGAVVPGNSGVATPSGTVLVFTQDADYAPIYNGTFTVDTTGAKVGTVVFVELGPAATQPTFDANVFELQGTNTYQAGKRNEYAFRVAATGKIHYVIAPLP